MERSLLVSYDGRPGAMIGRALPWSVRESRPTGAGIGFIPGIAAGGVAGKIGGGPTGVAGL
jgi:hypothetical protein